MRQVDTMSYLVQELQERVWTVDCGHMVGSTRELAEFLMRERGMTVLVDAREFNRVEPRSLVVLVDRGASASLPDTERDAIASAMGEYERMVIERC